MEKIISNARQELSGLLGIWGGEAISNLFYEDEILLKKLRSIGVPCLIKAVIPKEQERSIFKLKEEIADFPV